MGVIARLGVEVGLPICGRGAARGSSTCRTYRLMPAIVCLALAAFGSASAFATDEVVSPSGELIVQFRDGVSSSERSEINSDNSATEKSKLAATNTYVINIPNGTSVEDAIADYKSSGDVAFVEPNSEVSLLGDPNDPYLQRSGEPLHVGSFDQWGLNNIGQNTGLIDADIDAVEGWRLLPSSFRTGSPWPRLGVTVGVIDTGVNAAHPDLAGQIISNCFTATSGSGTFSSGCNDDQGHGTMVSGMIAARANNGIGGAGIAPGARIQMCKALSANGSGYLSDVAACIVKLVDQADTYNTRVISMSLGSSSNSSLVSLAVEYAKIKGVLLVASAGNSGKTTLNYPAAYNDVVSVGATDRNDNIALFSTYNQDVEISAPGVSILSTNRTGTYSAMSGTSASAPQVAAVAALVSIVTGLRGPDLRARLDSTTDDLGPKGRDVYFGFGRVNLCRALGGNCRYTPGKLNPSPPVDQPAKPVDPPKPSTSTNNGIQTAPAVQPPVVKDPKSSVAIKKPKKKKKAKSAESKRSKSKSKSSKKKHKKKHKKKKR